MPSAKRIICVGHAALDRIYRIEAFPPQPTKVRAIEHVEVGGGMAANAAVAISRLGGKAELWSRTGDDTAGSAIRAGLRAERVDEHAPPGMLALGSDPAAEAEELGEGHRVGCGVGTDGAVLLVDGAEGRDTACLYVDLRNPYSSRCYAKIGFTPVCPSNYYPRVSGPA